MLNGDWLGFLSVLAIEVGCLLAVVPALFVLELFQPVSFEKD